MKLFFKNLAIIFLILIFTQCKKESQPIEKSSETVIDADGNTYKTIKLGNQVWMLENLKTTKYNDGTPITKWTFGTDWHNSLNPIPLYQWALTLDLNNIYPDPIPFNYYGAMYNEFVFLSGKLAPSGWRIPTEQDFKTLELYVASQGYTGNEATALKSKIGWTTSSSNGSDVFGFKGLPNGYIAHGGTATGSEIICSWATSDVNTAAQKRRIVSLFNTGKIIFGDAFTSLGAGVRCIKN